MEGRLLLWRVMGVMTKRLWLLKFGVKMKVEKQIIPEYRRAMRGFGHCAQSPVQVHCFCCH